MPEKACGPVLRSAGDLLRASAAPDAMLAKSSQRVTAAVSPEAGGAARIDRVSARQTCTVCGKDCHDHNRQPLDPWGCDRCSNTAFKRRADENAAMGSIAGVRAKLAGIEGRVAS